MPTGNPLSRFIQAIRGFLPGTRRNRRTVAVRNESVRAGVRRGTSASPRAPSPRQHNKNSGPVNVTPIVSPPRRPPRYSGPRSTRKVEATPEQKPNSPGRQARIQKAITNYYARHPEKERVAVRALPQTGPTMENMARMSNANFKAYERMILGNNNEY
jgi:hypothetical protein